MLYFLRKKYAWAEGKKKGRGTGGKLERRAGAGRHETIQSRTGVCTVVLFVIAANRRLRWPSTGDWLKKFQPIGRTMECYMAKKKETLVFYEQHG